ncbi:hypothetical protein OG455_33030 [Kitasatospora sp. NBC_01287]|uniref:hypothetical protein n=1 Tax=Kitasatospora sp. NBC_01287 TaxID=2903573 RepID=UPI00224E907F|nr:hypothetical protein [Kitasatospora sp. NBC_01287]MCX4750284.1 hypothetical protein [Kitasatospora sp. NBC_01287]
MAEAQRTTAESPAWRTSGPARTTDRGSGSGSGSGSETGTGTGTGTDQSAEQSAEQGVILAVDFAATGRPDAGFGQLVPQLGTDLALWETLVPAPGEERELTGEDYLERWSGQLRAAGPRVAAVFGYCASSVFALALAERIGRWQARPAVVLFDPTAITGPTVLRYGFHRVIDSLAAVLGAEAVEQARAEAAAATERTPELLPLTEEFLRIYQAAGQAAFAKLGLGADRAEELVAWFRSYLHYVVAASELSVSPDLSGVTTIRANDLPAGFLQAPRELRFDVEHTGLLGHPEVARAVADLLG